MFAARTRNSGDGPRRCPATSSIRSSLRRSESAALHTGRQYRERSETGRRDRFEGGVRCQGRGAAEARGQGLGWPPSRVPGWPFSRESGTCTSLETLQYRAGRGTPACLESGCIQPSMEKGPSRTGGTSGDATPVNLGENQPRSNRAPAGFPVGFARRQPSVAGSPSGGKRSRWKTRAVPSLQPPAPPAPRRIHQTRDGGDEARDTTRWVGRV